MQSHLVSLLLAMSLTTIFGDNNRDLVPLVAPTNLTLLEIKGRQVLIEWDPVQPLAVRGFFRGYLVRTWNHAGSQVYAFPPEITRANVEFFPFSKNFITVSVRNEKYVGPPSEAISFDAPQIEPNLPYVLNVFTLSDKAVLVRWHKPTEPNGVLLGYKIYCRELNDTIPGEVPWQMSHEINDPDKLQAKLTGLEPDMRYTIGVSAVNCAGESDIQTTDVTLEPHDPAKPSEPTFLFKINHTTPNRDEICYQSPATPPEDEEVEYQDFDYYDSLIINETKKTQGRIATSKPPAMSDEDHEKRCLVDCMVLWLPDVENNPGENFYFKYKVKGEKEYQVTEPETSEDFIILHNFDACKSHEIVLTAVDGDYSTDSGIFTTAIRIF